MVLPHWISCSLSSLPFSILSPTFLFPLTNLPYTHRLSLSDFIFQPHCLLQFLQHLTPPPVHHSLTILTLNVSLILYLFVQITHYRNTMLYAMLWDFLYSQLCRFAVNLPSISVTSSSAVYEAGGHEILVQLLFGSCARTVANSAGTLGNMAAQEVIRCSILSHGAIQALVEPLKTTDTQVLVNTTQCLAVLACDTEARAEVGVCV